MKYDGTEENVINELAAENSDLRRDNADLKAQLAGLEMLLANLLAVIHRDGGQYQDKHGTGKACVDAQRVFTDTAAQLAESERKRERLKSHIKESKRLIKMVEAREEYAWEKIAELREAAAWYMECRNTLLRGRETPPPNVSVYYTLLDDGKWNNILHRRRMEFGATVKESERALRAKLKEV